MLPGDFDGNRIVDGADLAKWRGDFGVNPNSDADNDGDSDGMDFLIWQRNLRAAGSMANISAVPEPTAASIAVTATILLLRRVKRGALRLQDF